MIADAIDHSVHVIMSQRLTDTFSLMKRKIVIERLLSCGVLQPTGWPQEDVQTIKSLFIKENHFL